MIEELEAIMEVMEAGFDPHWGEAWSHAQVLASLQFSHTHCLIVDSAGKSWAHGVEPAGFLLSRNAVSEEELLLVAVKPEFRRRGIGGTLIELFADAAADRGAEQLFLEMRDNNPAQSVYRRHGFEPIGRRKAYYRLSDGTRLDAITFGRTIGRN